MGAVEIRVVGHDTGVAVSLEGGKGMYVYWGQMRLVPELTATANPDGTIRIEIVPGHSLQLNETGTFLWEGLARGETPETLRGNLCAEFDVTPEVAAADIERFLELLEENLLLER